MTVTRTITITFTAPSDEEAEWLATAVHDLVFGGSRHGSFGITDVTVTMEPS